MFGIPTQLLTIALLSLLVGAGSTAMYYRRVALRVDKEANELEQEALAELEPDGELPDLVDEIQSLADSQEEAVDDAEEMTKKLWNAVEAFEEDAEGATEYLEKVMPLVQTLEALDRQSGELCDKLDSLDDDTVGYGVDMDPPNVGRSIIDIFKVWLHERKAAKMAKRGYIKWIRVGSRMQTPRWVKPEKKGAGVYEYHEDDQIYVFPEEAMVTDGQTGAFVAMHKRGEAEPIDIRNPGWPATGADWLQRLHDMVAARDPEDGFGGWPIGGERMKYIIVAVAFIGIWATVQFTGVFG